MGLSDACFDISTRLREERSEDGRRKAVEAFRAEIDHYSKPPFNYGDELGPLAAACDEFLGARSASNSDPLQRVIFLADAIPDYLDTPPSSAVLGQP